MANFTIESEVGYGLGYIIFLNQVGYFSIEIWGNFRLKKTVREIPQI